ncbi:phospholipase D-like domain-containing protein [Rhodococcus sp. 2H158]
MLLEWVSAGVQVYSLAGLHAKTILAESIDDVHGAFLVIGSANLSRSSATRLTECVVLTDSRECLDEARGELIAWKLLAGSVLTADELRDLENQFGLDRSSANSDPSELAGEIEAVGSKEAMPAPRGGNAASSSRPTSLLLLRVAEEIEPSSEARYHKDRIAAELGCDGQDSDSLIFVFRDQNSPEWRLSISERSHVVVIDASKKGHVSGHTYIAPPGRVVYVFDDECGDRYYYLNIKQSSHGRTWSDVVVAFQSLSEKPEFERNYYRKPVIDALLALWPDISEEVN